MKTASAKADFDQRYQTHLKHLKLKGLQPKTIDGPQAQVLTSAAAPGTVVATVSQSARMVNALRRRKQ